MARFAARISACVEEETGSETVCATSVAASNAVCPTSETVSIVVSVILAAVSPAAVIVSPIGSNTLSVKAFKALFMCFLLCLLPFLKGTQQLAARTFFLATVRH